MAVFSKIFSFASLALYLTLFQAVASATPLQQIRREFDASLAEKSENIKRAGTIAVLGVQDGASYPRISLRMMAANNPDQFTLYLLAMHNFQAMNQNTVLSYYDVASIHGVPPKDWDGVHGDFNKNGAPGYCVHSTPTFPGWHRAYLALFEQAFYAQAKATANSFKDASQRSRYQKALVGMRLPYFDWAQGPGKASTVVPNYITDKMISIPNPAGGQQTIINPLFRYDHHPLDTAGMLSDPWDFWPTTLRYPTADNTPNVVSRNDLMVNAIQNQAQSLKDQVYNLFTQCANYMEFSNDQGKYTSPGCSNSLEGAHDNIHFLIGGSNKGHMVYLWWSAFDPSFWLHHVNVDRLFAMWQVIYPYSYITSGKAAAATYTYPIGTTVDGNTPLVPFHKDTSGNFWNSYTVRNLDVFKYTYPELQQARGSSANMKNIVNYLYGGSSAASLQKRGLIGDLLDDVDNSLLGKPSNPIAAVTNNVVNILPKLQTDLRNLLTPTGRKQDYAANIKVQRFGLNDSFGVYGFFGNHTSDATQLAFDPNLVGQYGVFSNPGMSMMRLDGQPLVVANTVPLTAALVTKIQQGALKSLDPADVMPYLKQNLNWVVATSAGKMVDLTQVPGLDIQIVQAACKPAAADDQFPTWNAFETVTGVAQAAIATLI